MEKHILVIDDEEAIRKSFLLALEETDYRVETAASGEDGLNMLGHRDYDLVFLDLKMPGINGVETLRRIRRRDSQVPVYIITAFYPEYLQMLNTSEDDGVQFEVIRKPIGAHEIRLIADGVLQSPKAY